MGQPPQRRYPSRWIATWIVALVIAGGCTNATSPSSTPTSAPTVEANAPQLSPADAVVTTSTNDTARVGGAPSSKKGGLPTGTLKRLQSELKAYFVRAPLKGYRHSALVVDLDNDQTILNVRSKTLMKPASNTKLFTTAAALGILGPDYRFETGVYTDGWVDKKGVVRGNLYMVGAHDFTWSEYFYPTARFPVEQLVAQLKAKGIHKVTGKVHVHGEFVVDGKRFSTYKASVHRKAALKLFYKVLKSNKISVKKGETFALFHPPQGAKPLAVWRSVPLSVATWPVNSVSHNEFADSLCRHIGLVKRNKSTYEAGGAEVVAFVKRLGINTKGMKLNDGSGLSHDNRVTASQLVGLIKAMRKRPEGQAWFRTMSKGGVDGTLKGRLRVPDTQGRVFAKTGTLNGVITTSGVLVNRHNGHTYAFAMLMNDVPRARSGGSGRSIARNVQDRVLTHLGSDVVPNGARPATPTLRFVGAGGGGGNVVSMRWEAVPGATAYRVWISDDGLVWDRSRAVVTKGLDHSLRKWPSRQTVYVRLTALNRAGESEPSDAYAARLDAGRKILVVDGNDRWQAEPARENPLAQGHDHVATYVQAMPKGSIDSCANEAVVEGKVWLPKYDVVIWSLGEESSTYATFDAREQKLVQTYLQGGGNLLVSGSETGFDLAGA